MHLRGPFLGSAQAYCALITTQWDSIVHCTCTRIVAHDRIYSRLPTTFPYCKQRQAGQEATFIVHVWECRLHMITYYCIHHMYIEQCTWRTDWPVAEPSIVVNVTMTFWARLLVAVAHTITVPASSATRYDGISIPTSTAVCEKKINAHKITLLQK